MSQGNELQRLESDWWRINTGDKSRYILQNVNKSDCSFLVKDRNNENSQKILKSFKWILSDMSPYFKTMFETNSNCKEIPIDDPCFEDFLFFAHTEILPDFSNRPFEQLLEMHERAKIYQMAGWVISYKLESMISELVKNKWIYFFEMLFKNKRETSEFADEIRKALCNVPGDDVEKAIEMSMDKIVKYDVDFFITFITFISKGNRRWEYFGSLPERSFILKTIETYLEKNPSFVEKIKEENITKYAFISVLYIDEYTKEFNLEKFKDYPTIIELLK